MSQSTPTGKHIQLLLTRLFPKLPETLGNVVLQVFAVCRERRPSVSFRASGSRHHERKEGTDEGVVSVEEAHSGYRHSQSLKRYECGKGTEHEGRW